MLSRVECTKRGILKLIVQGLDRLRSLRLVERILRSELGDDSDDGDSIEDENFSRPGKDAKEEIATWMGACNSLS